MKKLISLMAIGWCLFAYAQKQDYVIDNNRITAYLSIDQEKKTCVLTSNPDGYTEVFTHECEVSDSEISFTSLKAYQRCSIPEGNAPRKKIPTNITKFSLTELGNDSFELKELDAILFPVTITITKAAREDLKLKAELQNCLFKN